MVISSLNPSCKLEINTMPLLIDVMVQQTAFNKKLENLYFYTLLLWIEYCLYMYVYNKLSGAVEFLE